MERMEGDADIVREIFQAFIAESPQRRAKFQDALAAGDGERLGRLAHALKGASSTLMAKPLWEAAQALEQACREKDPQAPARLTPGLLKLLDDTVVWMREHLAGLGTG
jgi:HPt (histidine-containing phosphotransfer) domain-containing protein